MLINISFYKKGEATLRKPGCRVPGFSSVFPPFPVAVTVTLVLLVWLKRAGSFVGLWQVLTDKTKTRVFSFSSSPPFDIRACQGILELLSAQGHGCQRRCPSLLVSILVARRGFGQCVYINCLLASVQRVGWPQTCLKIIEICLGLGEHTQRLLVWICLEHIQRLKGMW